MAIASDRIINRPENAALFRSGAKRMNEAGRPTIAVFMSAYDEPQEWVRQSIDSALAQTWQNVHLYIVFDNPSGDLEDYLDERACDSRITLIKNERNLGVVGSQNAALRRITEDYIARLDADDIALPTRLEREMAFMEMHDLDFVMSAAASIDDQGSVLGLKETPDLLTENFIEIERITNLSIHSSWLVKRSVYGKLKGYRCVDCCEDYDFLLRSLQAGIKVGRIADPLVCYRFHEGSISADGYRIQRNIARILNDSFKRGIEIASISPEDMNRRGRETDSFNDEELSEARGLLGDFSVLYSQGRLSAAAVHALKGCFVSKAFRSVFFEEAMRQAKLKYALRKLR